MRRMVVSLLTAVIVLAGGAVYAGEHAHWGYSGDTGPAHWGDLDESFIMCALGKNQSPINLTGFVEAELEAIKFDYNATAQMIRNNGHTVQVIVSEGDSLVIDGKTFELKQFHFHAPSENRINGKSFPLEAHLCHLDEEGNLTVIAVLFEEGGANPALKALWSHMPEKVGEEHSLADVKLNPMSLLPKNKDYYRFNGSLTTPPCTEGVRWLVMKNPVTVSEKQVEAFEHVMHHPNNRPLQPLNARVVLK